MMRPFASALHSYVPMRLSITIFGNWAFVISNIDNFYNFLPLPTTLLINFPTSAFIKFFKSFSIARNCLFSVSNFCLHLFFITAPIIYVRTYQERRGVFLY